MEDILRKIRVVPGKSAAHVGAAPTPLPDELLKKRDDPVVTAAAGILPAEAVVDFLAAVETEYDIMAFFIGPFYDLICHTDPIGSQRKTEIFLFLLLDRAGIGDQILADLEVHQRLPAEKVNFQISAHTGIFHQKIQGALSGLE